MEKEEKKTISKEKKDKAPTKDQIIKDLEKQVQDLKSEYLRSRADFDNFRKRKEKEMSEAKDKAVIDFVLDLFPSIDNFEMSLKMTENQPMFIKGVEMISKNLKDTLKSHHFEEFEPKVGENFDLYIHEPILIEDKSKKPGKVIATLKKGYKHKDKIVRPARVQVVKEEDN